MSHESFDDEAVAALINRNFVPIKADRQQLPDLDQVYMLATQLMNGGAGGWPLTAFLTPDGRPWTTRSRLELGEGQLQQDVQLRVPIHGAGLVQVAGDLQGGETVQQHPEDGGQLSRRSGTELPSLGITLEGVADIAAHITRVHDDMIAGKGLQFVYDQEVTSGTATLLRWSMLTPPR